MDTTLLEVTHPDENENPYWVTARNMYEAFDQWIQSNVEDKTLIVSGGGRVALSGNDFSWSEAFTIRSLRTGALITIAANTITVSDGEILYVTVARPLSTGTIAMSKGSLAHSVKNVIPIGIRVGTIVHLFSRIDDIYDNRSSLYSTASIGATSSHTHEFTIGTDFQRGTFQILTVELTAGTCNDATIEFYDADPAGAGNVIYREENHNFNTSDHEDRNIWFMELQALNSLWLKVTNNGAIAATFDVGMRIKRD